MPRTFVRATALKGPGSGFRRRSNDRNGVTVTDSTAYPRMKEWVYVDV
ncbi:MAG: hypothetical protein ACYCT3_12250 [Acidiferrobacter sp.]